MDKPELLLSQFDLVFAVGRSAIEAMASGCAVIVADRYGLGGLVTEMNFSAYRDANFAYGITTGRLLTEDTVYEEITRFDRISGIAGDAKGP